MQERKGKREDASDREREKANKQRVGKSQRAGGSRQASGTALDGKDASWQAGGEPRHVIP